ncbi:MAG: hypothetical protein JJ992_02305, partial [Planctomycetes bacterium]|nr:hypothetical protein [Planctomycetota bacterium]
RAARDGQYCFASRMVAAGTASPAAAGLVPELRIVVDTKPPRLTMDATVETSGSIRAVWEVYDDYLDPDKVMLQYQMNPGQPWKPLEIERSPSDELRRTLRGETRWKPDQGAAIVTVRLEARDSADNVNELSRRLILPLSIPSPFGPRTPPQPTSDVPPDPFAEHGLSAAEPADPATVTPPAGAAVEGEPPVASAADPAGVAWPSQTADGDSWTQVSAQNVSRQGPAGPPAAQQASPGSGTPPQPLTDTAASEHPVPSTDGIHPPVPDESAVARAFDLPPGERPRMTKAKRFNLDYSIDAVGPAGVEKVEVGVTRNGGRDWDLWGVDEDRESPLLVEVESEGVYGFRVVIVGKNGLASQMPRPGDLADLWVGVDTTDPVAEITSASYGKNEYAGHLDIRWTAVDTGLGARPVTLMFSDRAEGPWTTIASGLPNTGQYYWRVDSRVPEEFFLKMEVRDEAGNLCVHQLAEPIRSAGLTPRGRIRGIEPVAN